MTTPINANGQTETVTIFMENSVLKYKINSGSSVSILGTATVTNNNTAYTLIVLLKHNYNRK